MFGFSRYNYDKFERKTLMKDFALSKFGTAPEPGDKAPDFELRTIDGDKVQLSDFRGEKNVVLTFGSATCPLTAGSISDLNELYSEYSDDDAEFLFVYVREAHPGEEIPAHKSMNDKVAAAEMFRDEEEVDIPVLVDDLNGKVHRKYGSLPNPTFIIDKSGRIAFRALSTRPKVVGEALDELLERQEERGVDHAVVHGGEDVTAPSLKSFFHVHRALERGGKQAIDDFKNEMGFPGRLAVKASRIAGPVAENPGTVAGSALAIAAVVALSLWAGKELRRRRFDQTPYRYDYGRRKQATSGGYDDYAVGI